MMMPLVSCDSARIMRKVILVALVCLVLRPSVVLAIGQEQYLDGSYQAGDFVLVERNGAAPIYVDGADYAGVVRAAGYLRADIQRVTNRIPPIAHGASLAANLILVGTLGKSELIDRLVVPVRFWMGRECFGHKSDLHEGCYAGRLISIKNPVDDAPVIDRLLVGVSTPFICGWLKVLKLSNRSSKRSRSVTLSGRPRMACRCPWSRSRRHRWASSGAAGRVGTRAVRPARREGVK